jgi:hypothetical protein
MIHHLVGGAWSVALLRILDAGAATMPLLALLFIPLLFGLSDLYPWARPEAVAADPMLDRQHIYMNAPLFIARSVLYIVVWVLLAYGLRRWSAARDRTADPRYTVYLRRISAGGLVVIAFSVTFAMIDWVMSLEPHWHSSVHPAVVGIGALLGAFALGVGITALLSARAHAPRALVTQVRTDLGGMFIGFAILWAYLAYSQFLLVWTGDIPEEVRWYSPRIEGGWQWLAIGVVGGQLVLPMALLVPRRLRLDTRVLGLVALGVLLAHAVDVFWLIAPAHGDATPSVHWVELTIVCAMGGWWVALLAWRLGQPPGGLDATSSVEV